MLRRWSCLLCVSAMAMGCEAELQPVITQVAPLNRATGVEITTEPRILVGGGAEIDPTDRKVVLYDVTGGARMTVGGEVEVVGSTMTYLLKTALEAGHDYQLEILTGAVSGGEIDRVDGSEWPAEPVSWPYHLRFSTGSRPRVRAAYLDTSNRKTVHIYFSQSMNPMVTGPEIQVTDLGGKLMPAEETLWSSESSARLDLLDPLEPASIYTLKVSGKAVGTDGSPLDGDDDGKPGEPDDDFTVQFTGSQKVIRSRLQ
jgi:hypothetical protein